MRFLVVYVREAHSADGWQVPQNLRDKVVLDDPKTTAERAKVAKQFAADNKLTIPVVVDAIDDKIEKAYAGWPDRLYVVDAAGKLAYVGGPGPRGFKPNELPAVLKRLTTP